MNVLLVIVLLFGFTACNKKDTPVEAQQQVEENPQVEDMKNKLKEAKEALVEAKRKEKFLIANN